MSISLATSNRRLLKLADFLDTVPKDRFDYSSWVGDDWGGKQDLSCGTTACALGWATVMPEFRRLGLRLIRPRGYRYANVVNIKEQSTDAFDSHAAAVATFGITEVESYFLFEPECNLVIKGRRTKGPGFDANAQTVAQHIRRFVRDRSQIAQAA